MPNQANSGYQGRGGTTETRCPIISFSAPASWALAKKRFWEVVYKGVMWSLLVGGDRGIWESNLSLR